jgi:hypothetical protein
MKNPLGAKEVASLCNDHVASCRYTHEVATIAKASTYVSANDRTGWQLASFSKRIVCKAEALGAPWRMVRASAAPHFRHFWRKTQECHRSRLSRCRREAHQSGSGMQIWCLWKPVSAKAMVIQVDLLCACPNDGAVRVLLFMAHV